MKLVVLGIEGASRQTPEVVEGHKNGARTIDNPDWWAVSKLVVWSIYGHRAKTIVKMMKRKRVGARCDLD